MLKIFSRIKLTYKSILITSLTGFDIAFTNVEDTLKQRQDKVVLTLFQRCFNVGHRCCINVVQCWKSDVGFCLIFNVESTSFQRWSTTLKQHWTDVEMLAGFGPFWSVKYLNFEQKLPVWTADHTFVESGHHEVIKNPCYFFVSRGERRKISAHGLTLSFEIECTSRPSNCSSN